jgi:hypothetical protein
VLTHCAATPARESTTGSDSISPAKLDTYPAGLACAENDLAPLVERVPQPSRRCWQHHRVVLAAVITQVAVALAGLGVGFALRGESGDRPTSLDSPTAVLVPHSAPLIAGDASDFLKNATFPDGTPAQVNQRSAKAAEIRN